MADALAHRPGTFLRVSVLLMFLSSPCQGGDDHVCGEGLKTSLLQTSFQFKPGNGVANHTLDSSKKDARMIGTRVAAHDEPQRISEIRKTSDGLSKPSALMVEDLWLNGSNAASELAGRPGISKVLHTVEWNELRSAFMLWILLLSCLLGGGHFTSAIAQRATDIWMNLNNISPPAMKDTISEDKDDLDSVDSKVTSCIHHAPLESSRTFLELLSTDRAEDIPRLAIAGASDDDRSWTFVELKSLVSSPAWSSLSTHKCVSPALSNGSECAATLVCLIARTKCAPIDPAMRTEEATAALQRVGAEAVLVSKGGAEGVQSAARGLGVAIWSVPAPGTTIDFVPELSFASKALMMSETQSWNTTDDVALLLRTSGTTGKSKVVPLSPGQLVTGARSIATSMRLCQDDLCLNAMPLFHIGGISCNLLGSIVSGGCVICLDQFTPASFVERLGCAMLQPTWYYSSPAIHLALVNFCSGRPPNHSLRLVRSGAAALSPALQENLRELWGCQVLATYSMTECMPIASAVVDDPRDSNAGMYNGWIAPLGSVGRPVGPTVTIRGGEVMLAGYLVMRGYEGSSGSFTTDGLLPTGDQGYFDSEGFLRLTGRKKETINRGGETIPPEEVEESLLKSACIQEVAAFAVPQELLGEMVGLAVVPKKSKAGVVDLLECVSAIKGKLHRSHFPGLIAFVDSLPRTPSGKVQRLSLYVTLKSRGGPEAAMMDPACTMIVDARGSKSEAIRYVTPNPDTVASILSPGEGEETEVELVDSLGMTRTSSRKEVFEVNLALQMYVVGWVAITFNHWVWFGKDAVTEMLPPLHLLMRSMGQGYWHLGLFFGAAGYLDRHDQNFGVKDAFLFITSLGLHPLMWLTPGGLKVGPKIFSQYVHIGGWFFNCLFAARVFSIVLKRLGTSKMMQVCMGFLYSYLWTNGIFLVWPRHVGWWLGPVGKLAFSTFTYLVFSSGLPEVVERLACHGPKTQRDERKLGALLWLLFVLWNLANAYAITDPSPTHFIGRFQVPTITSMVGLLLEWIHIGLLAAALSYFPFSAIPDVALRGLLPAMLLMPWLYWWKVDWKLSLMFHAVQSSVGQMLLLFILFGGFLSVATLLQTGFDWSTGRLLACVKRCW